MMVKLMKKKNKLTISALSFACALATVSCQHVQETDKADIAGQTKPTEAYNIDIWPTLNIEVKADANIEKKVAELLAKMTLEQKIAQMIQPEIRDITVEDMRKYGFGSYLNGGGSFPNGNKHSTPADWITLAENMYQASVDDSLDGINIPTIWGTDAVHGHNNVIGATLFPHNIGLGAANNPDLIEKIASITATEVMVTGIDWVFAPTVAVVRNDRWGRTYEGYSEDPDIVKAYAASIVRGLQGHADQDFLGDTRVISTVKHFLGDGGTVNGDDQGDNIASEQALFDLHAQGYVGGLTAGAQSVMASFNSWHGEKIHGKKYLLTDVLKNKMGFDGFVVGDWNGHGQVAGCSNDNCPQAANAGLDIYMVPTDAWKPLYENLIAQVKSGVISQARIDDAVTRILRVKFRAGVFDKPSPAKRAVSGKTELIGQKTHRDVAQQAVRESLVLLKNKGNILPLKPNQHILVAGDGADNIGKQSGGWSITWQGTQNTNAEFPGGTSIYAGIAQQVTAAGGTATLSVSGSFEQKPDVAIVVFGEEPYAEGHGDRDNLEFQRGNKTSLALLKQLKAQEIPVVSVFISGRPMWVNAELNTSDAFVAAWLPGSEGAGIADVLLTNAQGDIQYDFSGRLSFSWPKTATQLVNRFDQNYQPLLPYGFGLSYVDNNVLPDNLPEESEFDSRSVITIEMFNGVMQQPWTMALLSQQGTHAITSNTVVLDNISYKTTDKVVQEDAFTIKTTGKELVGVRLLSNFPEDLRAPFEASSSLAFAVKVNKPLEAEVNLAMLCEARCGEGLNITDELNKLAINQWHNIQIDLNCFKQAGVDMSQVNSPFNLTTNGSVNLSLAEIALVPNSASSAMLSCQ